MRLPTPQWICVNPCNLWENCFGCVGSTILQNRQAEDVLPQISQILTDGACLEFCEFCVLWEYSSPTDCTDQHRWLVALIRPRNSQNSQKFWVLLAAWVRQDAIPSYICVNPCYLWENLLYKKLLCVPWVLWEYSFPTDCTDQHRWLVALVRPRNPQNSQKFGCVSGCVGMAGCHTLLHLCKSVLSVGDPSLQEASVRSVGSVGIQFSHGLH